jgi:hypothetical protein
MFPSQCRGARSSATLIVALSTVYVQASLFPDAGRTLIARGQPSVMIDANCSSAFSWMDNGKGQSPCTVAGWEQEACASTSESGTFSHYKDRTEHDIYLAWLIPALGPGNQYDAPNATTANPCTW